MLDQLIQQVFPLNLRPQHSQLYFLILCHLPEILKLEETFKYWLENDEVEFSCGELKFDHFIEKLCSSGPVKTSQEFLQLKSS